MASKDQFEVEDSTDWLQTPLASLAPVEAALRCQVCTEFYTTPMITSCSHTFCSLCIRRCLSNDGKCPGCRAPDQELKLRCNWPLEEAVETFKKARSGLLEHARKPTIAETPNSPKRRREQSYEEDVPRKRTRSSARTRRRASMESVGIMDIEDGDEDYMPDDGLVECPICSGRMTEQAVIEHIDRCTGVPPKPGRGTVRSGQPTTINKAPPKPVVRQERLPHLHYGSYRDAALKKKLSDLGIPTGGSRGLLEKRHTEWVSIWNANCDSKQPRRKAELKQDLEKWERTQGAGSFGIGGNGLKPGAQLLDKDFDGMAWSSTHDNSFKELVANAKRKPPTGVAAPAPSAPADPLANLQPVVEDSSSYTSATASPQPRTDTTARPIPWSPSQTGGFIPGPNDMSMDLPVSSQQRRPSSQQKQSSQQQHSSQQRPPSRRRPSLQQQGVPSLVDMR
ncbi:DNA repair protein rad18 [Phlyctema vagabunda]|uniref:Postreplication repair E3 ubiquitin-protein ligase RAD18 n=1 Tax=Phlyctema vagabunda TaxID=108571 RepID=A0ABR4PRR0_9HELO